MKLTEIKTIKEFEDIRFPQKALREEAIKLIKEELNVDVISFLKYFYDITEEDLK